MTYPDMSRASWRKSSHSGGNGNCVEAGTNENTVAVRDGKDPHGPHLAFTPTAWRSFTASLKANA